MRLGSFEVQERGCHWERLMIDRARDMTPHRCRCMALPKHRREMALLGKITRAIYRVRVKAGSAA